MNNLSFLLPRIIFLIVSAGLFTGCSEQTTLIYVREGSDYTKSQVQESLSDAVKESKEIEKRSGLKDSADYLENRLGGLEEELNSLSDPYLVIDRSLKEGDQIRYISDRLKNYRLAAKEAAMSLNFCPIIEAPLPEGFMFPSPPGKIRVKKYPELLLAESKAGNEGKNALFRRLFHHIKKRDIPMTTPVRMTYKVERGMMEMESMAFYYPQGIEFANKAENGIEIKRVPAVTVISLGRKGGYSEPNFAECLRCLGQWLENHSERYEAVGKARVLAYNSPFVLWFKKYSEVQVPIRDKLNEK